MEKKRKQMAFDIDPDVHHQIKMMALMDKVSVNLWMARAINQYIKKRIINDNNNEQDQLL